MPFERKGGEEPPLEKARRKRQKKRIAELHFKWFNAVASGDTASALMAALDYNEVFAETYGQDILDDLLNDLQTEPANDD